MPKANNSCSQNIDSLQFGRVVMPWVLIPLIPRPKAGYSCRRRHENNCKSPIRWSSACSPLESSCAYSPPPVHPYREQRSATIINMLSSTKNQASSLADSENFGSPPALSNISEERSLLSGNFAIHHAKDRDCTSFQWRPRSFFARILSGVGSSSLARSSWRYQVNQQDTIRARLFLLGKKIELLKGTKTPCCFALNWLGDHRQGKSGRELSPLRYL